MGSLPVLSTIYQRVRSLTIASRPACLEAVLFRRFGHLSELLDPPIVGLVAQRLQGIGKPVDESLRQLRRELPFPLRDVAGANVPAIQLGCCAEQAVIPDAFAAGFLLGLVEAEERQDLRPQHHRAIQPQVFVANLQAIGAIVSPVQHVFDGAAGRVLQFEKVLLEGRGERVQLALVRDVVAARHRLMEPGFIRGLVVVHRRDEDIAGIPDEVKNFFKDRIVGKFRYADSQLAGRDYLLGKQFTVADGYLFVMLAWADRMKMDLSGMKNLMAFKDRVAARPNVQAAL